MRVKWVVNRMLKEVINFKIIVQKLMFCPKDGERALGEAALNREAGKRVFRE